MKKWQMAGLVIAIVLLAGIVVAEQMMFSTYYPAPAGRYREFSTTGRTTLATNEFGIETDEYARVGIGTTDPQALLHIRRDQNDATTFFIDNKQSGSESQTRLYIQSLNGGGVLTYRDEAFTAFSRTHLADRFELRADGGSSGLTLMSAKGGSDIRFYTDGDTPERERMRITSAGNVGIGTTEPAFPLTVIGSIGSSSPSTNGRIVLHWEDTGGGVGNINSFDTDHYTRIKIEGHPVIFNVSSTGNVGINTFNPTQGQLVVKEGAATLYTNSAGWQTTSDIRLKENIAPIGDDILSKVLQLRGIRFNWKADEDKQEHLGLIAQEVEKSFPEIVSTDSTTGYKGLAYGKFVPILIEAIKAQQEDIEQMRAEIESLKRK